MPCFSYHDSIRDDGQDSGLGSQEFLQPRPVNDPGPISITCRKQWPKLPRGCPN